jgi:adenylate cyclase
MQPKPRYRFQTLFIICLLGSLAGVVFQLINEQRLDFNSVLVGLPLGLVFGVLELFVFANAGKRFRRWSFTKTLVFKTLLYTAVIYLVTVGITIITGLISGHKLNELPAYLFSPAQLVLVMYALVVYGLLVFSLQIDHLLGEGMLLKFILGKYHHPREEERIFMFLDMKSSTTIAEQLGHVHFYSLMNELFHEITKPVLQTQAEIYQYVGDEVVLTWELRKGKKECNCIELFFLFKDTLIRNSSDYKKNFGVKPEFKAGIHFGKVISAQIGDLKREIVYNGDVLNTTARIRDACTLYGIDCIVSGELADQLKDTGAFCFEKIDTVILRGKEKAVELFSVSRATSSRFKPQRNAEEVTT